MTSSNKSPSKSPNKNNKTSNRQVKHTKTKSIFERVTQSGAIDLVSFLI